MKSVVLLAVCGVFLTGCTNPYRAPQPQLVAEANSVDLMLAEAADRATRALETLSAMESTQMPVKPIATVARAPQELQRAVTFEWSGPAEPLVEELARKSGYSYGVITPMYKMAKSRNRKPCPKPPGCSTCCCLLPIPSPPATTRRSAITPWPM